MPVLAGLIWVIKAGGDNFYIYAWALSCALIFFFLAVYPNVIAPLFNKFSSLEDGTLKTAIEQLAKENKFPLTKLYVVDGSTRSSHRWPLHSQTPHEHLNTRPYRAHLSN